MVDVDSHCERTGTVGTETAAGKSSTGKIDMRVLKSIAKNDRNEKRLKE